MLLDTEVFFKLAKVIYNISENVSVYTNALCVRTVFYEKISLIFVVSLQKITCIKTAKIWKMVFVLVQIIVIISMIPLAGHLNTLVLKIITLRD